MSLDAKRYRRLLAVAGFVALAVWGGDVALAADTAAPPGEEMILFQEIPSVFGASKYEQKVTEAPATVSIVTAAEIRRYGYRTLADLLRSLRGFHVSNDRNYSYAGVRGFGLPGDYNTRVLILIDGHRLNDSVFSAGYIGSTFPVDIDLIDRVEVIRGPGSSLYGTNALFGVINVITRRGRDYRTLEVSGEGGRFDTYKGRLTYGNRYPGGGELLLSGSALRSQGDDLYFDVYDDPATNNGVAEGRDDEDVHNLFLKGTLGNYTLTGAYSRRRDGYPTAAWETIFNDPEARIVDEQAYLDLQHVRSFSGWESRTRFFWDYYRYDGAYPYDGADYVADNAADPYRLLFKDYGYGERWGAEAQLSRNVLERHHLVMGAEFQENYRQDQGGYDAAPDFWLYLKDRRDSTQWALFFQDEIRFRDDLRLTAGVRYDHYTTFGGTTNPRLALVYSPLAGTTLKLLYGEAFRAPNAYELYYHDGGVTQKPTQDLDPETIRTWELAWEQALGESLRGVLSGFYSEIHDLINYETDPADGLLIFRNLDEVEAWGVEAELEGRWSGGLEGRVSYFYQRAENAESGKRLTNSPRHLAKINLVLPLVRERLFAGIEEQYTSSRKTVSGGETGGFAVTNLTLFSPGLAEGLDLSASVYNLFDKKYSDPGSEEHFSADYPLDAIEQDGLGFRVKMTYAF